MKIIELRAENIKRLTTVQIRPDGNLIQITGANGSGKTSVLDSIWWALGGTKNIQSQPLRRGAKSGSIRLDLGEIVVTRKFGEGGTSTVNVESADGARFPSPQAMLDKLLGTIAFDPLAFSRLKTREQFDALRSLVKVDLDFDAMERQNQGDFARRADLNKEAKALRARLAAYAPFPANLPAEKLNTSALVDEIANAGKHNADIERRKEGRVQADRDASALLCEADALHERANSLRRQADEIDEQAKTKEAKAAELREKLRTAPALPDPIDPAQVKARLAEAEKVNAEIERRARRNEIEEQAQKTEAAAKELTEKMEAREKAKQEAIAAAQMPIEGIGFGNGEVLLNGLPFDQASDAEQLRASTAIAMAANPKLRVIRIRDGSLLDENGLKLLSEMADERDYQVWIERVETSGKVGIVMEDGHLKEPDPEPSQEAAAVA